jgi:hypothetical protein
MPLASVKMVSDFPATEAVAVETTELDAAVGAVVGVTPPALPVVVGAVFPQAASNNDRASSEIKGIMRLTMRERFLFLQKCKGKEQRRMCSLSNFFCYYLRKKVTKSPASGIGAAWNECVDLKK